jgi:hypothetical protein
MLHTTICSQLSTQTQRVIPRPRHCLLLILQAAQAALKEAYLLAMCSRSFASGRVIIFFRTKQRAHRAKILFGLLGLPPAGQREV